LPFFAVHGTEAIKRWVHTFKPAPGIIIMIEDLIRANPPQYDELEKRSIDYIQHLRGATRPFSILLFLMPAVLLIIWIFFIESVLLLGLSVAIYIATVLVAIFARYRTEKRYRELTVSFGYYIIHSDYSMYTIRMASIVLTVLIFVLVETYRGFNQIEFFSVVIAFIVVSFILSVYSPRFVRYEKMSTQIQSEVIRSGVSHIASSTSMPEFTIRIVPEKKMKVANAYCTGILSNKVYVTDYLLENLTENEALVILAHELGHVIYRHNLKTLALTFFLLFASAVMFFSYLYISNELASALLTQAGIFLFILGIPALVPAVKRGYELQADMFASRFQTEEAAVNALLKTNYLNLTPVQASGGITHPPLPIRINRMRRAIKMRDLKAKF